jgi:serine/threonine-protein kinase RsbW
MAELEFIKKFSVNSTTDGLRKCLEIACEIQRVFNFEASKEFAFQTVLVESVTNAISHGNKYNEDLLTSVTISIDNEKIRIEVEDQGEGFDLDQIPSPIDKDHISLENGRGIFFIRNLSSSITTRGRGNIVDIIINR